MPSPTAEQPEQIRELFNRIAPHYDDLNQKLSLGLHQVWKQMTVRWAHLPRGGRALDLCCGSGDLALLLARRAGRQGHVIGLDFSPAMLSMARSRSRRLLPKYSLEWVLGDALALPFADYSFDGITMGYGLRNVIDIPRALGEMKRVLKPGCRAAILDFHRPTDPLLEQFQRWYLQTQVVSQAKALGLAEDYAYIDPSLDRFPCGAEQKQLALAAGFERVTFFPLMGGMMGVLVMQK
ncbi:MAG: bifunctional demethylmenaquinone methyltransferase/2-methoxy-6-polyprenyl-1,4-benzoquinol methylase UbiE [Thermostichus sp. DG02_5_bins_236]